jgi:hypothetical protein
MKRGSEDRSTIAAKKVKLNVVVSGDAFPAARGDILFPFQPLDVRQ